MLGLAAFLTAFYTMRQISLTFLGSPRSPLAEHAHESSRLMTIPLVLLSIFAIAAGWIGIPEEFPILGPLINNNFFHHTVATTIEELLLELSQLGLVQHAIETPTFSFVPLAISLVVALGGLLVGWLLYGRRPLEQGQRDPLIQPLGPVHTFLNRKWYWDELYNVLFIRPAVYFAETVVYEIADRGIIDGILHLIARAFYRAGYYFLRFEQIVISGGVDWLKDQFLGIAREFRQLQTGRVQEYALISTLIATALVAVILLINFGWFSGLF
jgi:NADH-quinone oxidoreductase subunit L